MENTVAYDLSSAEKCQAMIRVLHLLEENPGELEILHSYLNCRCLKLRKPQGGVVTSEV